VTLQSSDPAWQPIGLIASLTREHRLATALGIAVVSTIASSVSQRYAAEHPLLGVDSPEALLPGYRASGWACFAVGCLGLTFSLFGLRGLGVVGAKTEKKEEIELGTVIEGSQAVELEKGETGDVASP
jgi:hypothetical protein